MKNTLFIILTVFLCTSINIEAQNESLKPVDGISGQSNSKNDYCSTEESIVDIIWNLKEVQKRNKYVIKKSNGKRKLTILIYKKPEETEKEYYWLKVVEDNGSNFYSHYNFFVYPKHMKVVYFDTVNNKEIELKTWQNQLTKNKNKIKK